MFFFLNIEIDVDSSSLTHLLDSFGVIISLSHRKLVQVDARGNFFRKHWEVLPAQRSLNLHSIQFTLHCIALHSNNTTQHAVISCESLTSSSSDFSRLRILFSSR